MDATMNFNNGNYYNGFGYGAGIPQYNNLYGYQTYQPQNIKLPQNQNALSAEEINTLKNTRPSSMFDLAVDPNDALRSVCSHKENFGDVVQLLQDGTGDVYCPICNERWNPEQLDAEQVESLVKRLIAQMQNAKWIGDFPIDLQRAYFTIIPLLKKFPALYKLGMDNFNKYYNQHQFTNGTDTGIYAQYNSLFAPTYSAYGAQAMPSYYQQPGMPYGQVAPSMYNNYYNQQQQMQQVPPATAPVTVNPMQAVGIPGQQQMPSMPYAAPAPVTTTATQPGFNFATPQAYQPQTSTTAQQKVVTTTDGSKITTSDGSVSSEKSFKV